MEAKKPEEEEYKPRLMDWSTAWMVTWGSTCGAAGIYFVDNDPLTAMLIVWLHVAIILLFCWLVMVGEKLYRRPPDWNRYKFWKKWKKKKKKRRARRPGS